MNRRANTYVAVLLAVSGLVLVGPALVRARSAATFTSGGAGVDGPTASGATAHVVSGLGMVSASGNGIKVVTRASAMLRRPLRFSGTVGARAVGDTVEIERRGRQTHWTWAPTTHGTATASGSFSAVWPTNHIGRFAIRAVVETGRSANAASALSAHAASVSPSLAITVYRPSLATIYGPGLYGRRTACGESLWPRTLGVANRTLRCGTPVAIYYRGQTLVVPVIDRGPYAYGADWDLTAATAKALGMSGTATIGTVSRPGAHLH